MMTAPQNSLGHRNAVCKAPSATPHLVRVNYEVIKLLLALINNPRYPETDLQQVKSYNSCILQAVSASQYINQCAAKNIKVFQFK